MKGDRPKYVIFYDGVNDGYYHCNPLEEIPTHSYRSRLRGMEEELDKSNAKLKSYSFGIFVRELSFSVQYFLV